MSPTVSLALPDGMTAHGASMDDVDATLTAINAAERLDRGAPLTSRADIVGDWQRPSVDPATDVVLVRTAGQVVAHAEQFHGRAFVHVHPDVRGRGIGTALAGWTEEHARAAGFAQVGQTIPTTATSALALLEARGYVPRWESWILSQTLDDDVPPPALPPGIHLRSLRRPGDDRALFELIDTAFSDWEDRDASMTFEDWRASYLDVTDRLPEPALVLEADGTLVGAALGQIEDDEGWIDQLAVARPYRGRGLGRALLQGSFARFREQGLRAVSLSTDSRTGARTLYEHVGMTVTETFTRLTLPLPGQSRR